MLGYQLSQPMNTSIAGADLRISPNSTRCRDGESSVPGRAKAFQACGFS